MDFEEHTELTGDNVETEATDPNVEDEEEEEGGSSELVVLDPSHPLMERVQAALTTQLEKQKEKLEIELREKQETFKSAQKDREEIGVELYGVQQQLARQQMLIEKEQDNHSAMVQLRKQRDQSLFDVRNTYQKMQEQIKEKEIQASSLRQEMETAVARLKYLSEAHTTVQEDIALTMRATEKAMSDVSKAQEEKLKQDLYVDRLTQDVDKIEQQIALTHAQCLAQAQETKAMKELLAEATMELEALCLEKKKLMHQWNNSLIGMRRRDEAYSSMVTARNIQQQQVHSMNTELENYKKSIVKEQEHNEQLTLLLRKIETDINHIKRLIDQCEVKSEALKVDYMTYTRALQETEQALTVVTGECAIKKNELSALRTQLERETLEKRRLEDAVMENMMQRLTMDKATQYSQKSLEKLRKAVQELEISLANVENEISQSSLDVSNVSSALKRLQQTLDESGAAIQCQNDQISKSQAEINRNNAFIERKQTQIDQLNKKIEAKHSKLGGGEDLGPLELKIATLQKQISDSMEQCTTMQQYWLRQQNELVKKTHEADEQRRAIDDLQKEELILSQKKMRLNDDLSAEEKQHLNVQHNIESLQKDMVRLNSLITDKRGEQDKLEQSNTLLEKDFVSGLKEAELEFLQLQDKVQQLQEEKERMLNSLVESEHQIMLWEKKIQLTKEMKESVDSETGQAEIKAMKAEIHRMQVRYSQLLRQQEKMIQDMEKAVYRRDTIIQRSDAQSKSGKKEHTQGYLKKKITDTQRKIKQTHKDISDCDIQINDFLQTQSNIVNEIQEKQTSCQDIKIINDSLQEQLQESEKAKQMAMTELLSTQSQVKYLTAAKENKYRFLHKSQDGRFADMQRQKEKLQALLSVVQKLETETTNPLLASLSSQLMNRLQKTQERDKDITVA